MLRVALLVTRERDVDRVCSSGADEDLDVFFWKKIVTNKLKNLLDETKISKITNVYLQRDPRACF